LQVNQLHFSYPQHAVFNGLSLHAPPGVSLVRGGDGAGKTTLLRLLAGDLAANAGDLSIQGVHLSRDPAAYQKKVFWVEPRTTAFDQIAPHAYFQSLHGRYPHVDLSTLNACIEGLSLAPHLDKPLYMLSTGSQRKVWLAAAFASGAALTLLDSPFAALDKPSITFVMALLRQAAQPSAQRTGRAWVVAHYDALGDVPLVNSLDLGP
jgi:ABC-type transport system involved in cytochrome c biogenesis ATPase subunit